MYLRHFQLKSRPFALNPDPNFMYPSEQHVKALTMLEYAIESQSAFSLLTGEIGSGKTTLLRQFIRGLGPNMTVGLISNTHERFRSIEPWALAAFAISPAENTEVAQYEALTSFIIREYGRGRRTLLILDEAQNLTVPALEELRLLSNINSEEDVALQTLLVGQPELRAKLERPELRQFAQRIGVDCHLRALSLFETECYVRHRLSVAGGRDGIFQQSAIRLIHKVTGGLPRLINQLCDLSLVYAFAEQIECVSSVVVARVVQDRMVRAGPEAATATATATAAAAAVEEGAPPPPAHGNVARERA